MKDKYVIGHNGLLGAFHYHWKFNTEMFDLKRDCVQFAAMFLLLIYMEVRLGAIVESSSKEITGTNETLCYKDLTLKLLQPLKGALLLVLEVMILLNKGKRKWGEQ